MKDILTTMFAMEEEIHHPGAARSSGFDLMTDIEDALRRLAHAIESAERLAA